MVVEEPRRRFVQIEAKWEPPDENVLVEDLERVAQCPATEIQLSAKLASGPCSLFGTRASSTSERTATGPRELDLHLLCKVDVVTYSLFEKAETGVSGVAKVGGSCSEEDTADIEACGYSFPAREQRLQGGAVEASEVGGYGERDLPSTGLVVAENDPAEACDIRCGLLG